MVPLEMPVLTRPSNESDEPDGDATNRLHSGFRREYEAFKRCFRPEGEVHLKERAIRNWAATKQVFRFNGHNSHAEKVATWIGLAALASITLGVMFDQVVIDTAAKSFVWEAIKAVVIAMLARIQAKESEKLRQEPGEGQG